MQQLGKFSLLVACYQIKERHSKNGKGLLFKANPMPVFESVLPSLMSLAAFMNKLMTTFLKHIFFPFIHIDGMLLTPIRQRLKEGITFLLSCVNAACIIPWLRHVFGQINGC